MPSQLLNGRSDRTVRAFPLTGGIMKWMRTIISSVHTGKRMIFFAGTTHAM